MEKEELHVAFEELLDGRRRGTTRALVHALIDLGFVTSLNCSWQGCVLLGVPLASEGKTDAGLTFDHSIAVSDGGSDRPENIRLLHFRCNMVKGSSYTTGRREALSVAGKHNWQDPRYRAKVIEAARNGSLKPEVVSRKSEAMKRSWRNPDTIAKRKQTQEARDKTPTMCECGAGPFLGLYGLHRHRCGSTLAESNRKRSET